MTCCVTNPMHVLQTIDPCDLSSVTGGANETEFNLSFGVTGVSAKVSQKPEETDKQLRCYAQVARQAGWLQKTSKTVNQQIKLCGPLR